MFGKPEWFREKTWGWGLTPITWQGWVYTAIWVTVMVIPYLYLLRWERWPEAHIWLTAWVIALVWDVKQIIDAKRRPERDVLYISDEEDEAGVGQLDLRVRR
jgi:hypothetical protein